jgi:hypothetical protein
MTGRVVFSALVSAAAMFVWGFLFWGLSGINTVALRPLPGEDAVLATLGQNLQETAVYHFPGMPGMAPTEAQRGKPAGLVIFRKEGVETNMVAFFAGGYLHFFVSALLMAGLLAVASPSLKTYGARLGFVFLGGLLIAVAGDFGLYAWWRFPLSFAAVSALGTATTWLVAAVVMAGAFNATWWRTGTATEGPKGGAFVSQPPPRLRHRE